MIHTTSAALGSFERQSAWSLTGLSLGLIVGVLVAENIVFKQGREMESDGFGAKAIDRTEGVMELAEPDRMRLLEARAEE